jgi:preprotein translocase subunit SecG
METLIIAVHVILAAGVIGFILIQRGKGAEAGASFGGGASQTVFGSQGSANFLSRVTAILATGFFVTSFALAYLAKQKADEINSLGLDGTAVEQVEQLPADAEVPPVESPADDLPEVQD